MFAPIKSSSSALPLPERIAVFYLILPLGLFGFWLQWPLALVWWAAWCYSVWYLIAPAKHDECDINEGGRRRLTYLIPIALFAASLWALFCGLGHVFHTTDDWLTRDAVLHDLTIGDWPVSYGQTPEGWDLLLRCPLGFYLVPAALAKLFGAGMDITNALCFLWTALGVSLLFISIANGKSLRAALGFIVLFIFFSGMDWAGYHITHDFNAPADITQHIEWWALGFQYSSNSTLLSWVPNHALPGWLGLTLLYRYREYPETVRLMPIVMVAAVFWSPLTGIGLLPFACLLLWEQWRKGILDTTRFKSFGFSALTVLPLAIPIVVYFGLDGSEIPGHWTWNISGFPGNRLAFIICYMSFVLLEFLILVALLATFKSDSWLNLSALILVALPFYWFGPGSDLAMRGSIPALTLICLRTFEMLSAAWPRWLMAKIVMVFFVLAVGAITPVHEMARAVLWPSWPMQNTDLITIMKGITKGEIPPHYVARITKEQNRAWLKTPVTLPRRESATNTTF